MNTAELLFITIIICLEGEFIQYLLQEGFGLSSSPSPAAEEVMVIMWSYSEASGCGQGVCLNRQNGAGPATDSLDHRAGAYYLLYGFLYNKLRHAIGVQSLLVPPFIF